MKTNTALTISYIALALSVAAVFAEIAIYEFSIPMPSNVTHWLMFAGYVWPLAGYSVAIYRKKLRLDSERATSQPTA